MGKSQCKTLGECEGPRCLTTRSLEEVWKREGRLIKKLIQSMSKLVQSQSQSQIRSSRVMSMLKSKFQTEC